MILNIGLNNYDYLIWENGGWVAKNYTTSDLLSKLNNIDWNIRQIRLDNVDILAEVYRLQIAVAALFVLTIIMWFFLNRRFDLLEQGMGIDRSVKCPILEKCKYALEENPCHCDAYTGCPVFLNESKSQDEATKRTVKE